MCPCRKPEPGLFTEAAFKWHLDLERSFVISDKWQDASRGPGRGLHCARCSQISLDRPGASRFRPADFPAIVERLLRLHTGSRTLAA